MPRRLTTFDNIQEVTIEVHGGTQRDEALKAALDLEPMLHVPVYVKFNDVKYRPILTSEPPPPPMNHD